MKNPTFDFNRSGELSCFKMTEFYFYRQPFWRWGIVQITKLFNSEHNTCCYLVSLVEIRNGKISMNIQTLKYEWASVF